MPQYSYHKPNLALDPFFEDETTTKKMQAVAALMRAEREEADALILKLIDESDFQTAYHLLNTVNGFSRPNGVSQMFNLDAPRDRFKMFADAVIKRHGEKAAVIPKIFERGARLNQILSQRAVLTEPELRFFLALLMNVDGRQRIFALVRQRFPDIDPLEKVLDWVYEMSQTRVVGSNSPNSLNVEIDDIDIAVLEGLLRDRDAEQIIEDLRSRQADITAEQLDERISKLSSSVVLQPLLES